MKSNKEDISSAMNWYNSLKTEDLAKFYPLYPHVNQMDSMTIVKYWAENIKG